MGAYTTFMDAFAGVWIVFVIVGLILELIPDDDKPRRRRK